jgi:hypothetical protein
MSVRPGAEKSELRPLLPVAITKTSFLSAGDMIQSMIMRRQTGRCVIRRVSFLILTISFCACGSRAELALHPVRGRITLDGEPLPRGTVSLRSDGEAAGWQQPTGTIGENGEFVIYTQGQKGSPPGKYRAVVFATEEVQSEGGHPGLPRSLIPERYTDPRRTPLRIDVTANPQSDQYRLELTRHE